MTQLANRDKLAESILRAILEARLPSLRRRSASVANGRFVSSIEPVRQWFGVRPAYQLAKVPEQSPRESPKAPKGGDMRLAGRVTPPPLAGSSTPSWAPLRRRA